jgi:hypothetical protein
MNFLDQIVDEAKENSKERATQQYVFKQPLRSPTQKKKPPENPITISTTDAPNELFSPNTTGKISAMSRNEKLALVMDRLFGIKEETGMLLLLLLLFFCFCFFFSSSSSVCILFSFFVILVG